MKCPEGKGHNGDCCCTCNHQFVMKVWTSDGKPEIKGWACLSYYFIDKTKEIHHMNYKSQHGCCEMHQEKK